MSFVSFFWSCGSCVRFSFLLACVAAGVLGLIVKFFMKEKFGGLNNV